MKLKYRTVPINLGGGAVSGCGTIHRSEIRSTLLKLSDDLEFPFDLNDYVLGSTGKKEYSGDIDLVIDSRWYSGKIFDLRNDLENLYGKNLVSRHGNMLHLKYPIVGYNSLYNQCQPRTGFVQVDFNFGNADWERFYHYSPGEDSEYKGAHRNLAIAAITAVTGTIDSRILDGYDRPVEQIRWKFSPNGFVQVRRISVKEHNTGVWKRKQEDTVLTGPVLNPVQISEILFPLDGTADDLCSLETIMSAVKRNFGMVDQERVWRRCAENFYDWPDGRNFIYPEEIAKYLPTDDK